MEQAVKHEPPAPDALASAIQAERAGTERKLAERANDLEEIKKAVSDAGGFARGRKGRALTPLVLSQLGQQPNFDPTAQRQRGFVFDLVPA